MTTDKIKQNQAACECGRPMAGKTCCEECSRLDGIGSRAPYGAASLIISELNVYPMSLYELSDTIGVCERQVVRVLKKLCEDGRVRRHLDANNSGTGGGANGGSGFHVYRAA